MYQSTCFKITIPEFEYLPILEMIPELVSSLRVFGLEIISHWRGGRTGMVLEV